MPRQSRALPRRSFSTSCGPVGGRPPQKLRLDAKESPPNAVRLRKSRHRRWAHRLQPGDHWRPAMNVRPSILCPIDFSEASAGALRYAAAIASHFATRLIVLTVEDPLLTEAADLGHRASAGIPRTCKREMARVRGTDLRARVAAPGDARIRRGGREAGAGDSARRPRALLRSRSSQHARPHRRCASCSSDRPPSVCFGKRPGRS